MLYTCLLLKFTEFVDARSALTPAPLPEGEGITLSVRKRTLPLNLLIGTFFAVACVSPIAAHAHEIRPAVVTAVVGEATLTVAISANFEAMLAGIGSAHRDTDDSPNANIYNALRALPPSGLEAAIRRDSRFLPLARGSGSVTGTAVASPCQPHWPSPASARTGPCSARSRDHAASMSRMNGTVTRRFAASAAASRRSSRPNSECMSRGKRASR